MAEGDGLLNRCTALKPYRGFESLRLRSSQMRGVDQIMYQIHSRRVRADFEILRKFVPRLFFGQALRLSELPFFSG